MIHLRTYQPADAEALAELYRASARELGAAAYSAEQLNVWARHPEEMEDFRNRLALGHTVIATRAGEIAAFGQLAPLDHIAYLYCSPRFARQGCATAIYGALEEVARKVGTSALHTEASRLSHPFFLKHGYHLVEVETVERHGVLFERFNMAKDLG